MPPPPPLDPHMKASHGWKTVEMLSQETVHRSRFKLAVTLGVLSSQKCLINLYTRVGISGTTAKSRQRKFVPSSHPSSHPGPFAVVATSRKSQTKVGTLACFDLL